MLHGMVVFRRLANQPLNDRTYELMGQSTRGACLVGDPGAGIFQLTTTLDPHTLTVRRKARN